MTEYERLLKDSAEIFKALSHPSRLCIVNKLTISDLNVSQMQDCLNISQSNLSQHLSILRKLKIIDGVRLGSEVKYSLIDNRMKDLVKILLE